MPLALFSKPKS